LSELGGLERLAMDGCSEIADLAPLAGLGNLTVLRLQGCTRVSDLSPIASLGKLTHLALPPSTGNLDLTRVVRDHPGLVTLDMAGTANVTDTAPLSGLRKLERLNLSRSGSAVDLRHIARLPRLRQLALSGGTEVRNVEALAQAKGLELVTAIGCASFGEEAAEALRHALPNCRVFASSRRSFGGPDGPGPAEDWDAVNDVF
jgi:internalin A